MYSSNATTTKERIAAQRASERARVRDWIEEHIPARFRESVDLARVQNTGAFLKVALNGFPPGFPEWAIKDQDAFYDATPRQYERNWFIYGKTGSCKTRALCSMLSRVMGEEPDEFDPQTCGAAYYDASDLFRAFSQASRNREGWAGLVDELGEVRILAVDDLGHDLTPSAAAALLRLLKIRFEEVEDERAQTLFTAQYSIEALARHWQKKDYRETGEAICRRLYEFCTPVCFDAPVNMPTLDAQERNEATVDAPASQQEPANQVNE